MTQPVVYMIAGPNGAGKTTAAMRLLPDFLSVHEFVNADEIARGLNPLDPAGQDVAAGRLMLERIDALVAAGKNFAFETTGASRAFITKLRQAKAAGFTLGLVYLWLGHVDFAKFRIRIRVAQGGHDIPADVIERQYKRGVHNIWHHYFPLVDRASFFENTLPSAYLELIAEKCDGCVQIYRPDIWKAIQLAAGAQDD